MEGQMVQLEETTPKIGRRWELGKVDSSRDKVRRLSLPGDKLGKESVWLLLRVKGKHSQLQVCSLEGQGCGGHLLELLGIRK